MMYTNALDDVHQIRRMTDEIFRNAAPNETMMSTQNIRCGINMNEVTTIPLILQKKPGLRVKNLPREQHEDLSHLSHKSQSSEQDSERKSKKKRPTAKKHHLSRIQSIIHTVCYIFPNIRGSINRKKRGWQHKKRAFLIIVCGFCS